MKSVPDVSEHASHRPDAGVIHVDVIRLVELSIMQTGAQLSRHTFPRITEVFSCRTEATLLARLLPLTSRFHPRQRATRSFAHTPAGFIHLTPSALHLWETSNQQSLTCSSSSSVGNYNRVT